MAGEQGESTDDTNAYRIHRADRFRTNALLSRNICMTYHPIVDVLRVVPKVMPPDKATRLQRSGSKAIRLQRSGLSQPHFSPIFLSARESVPTTFFAELFDFCP